MSEMNRNGADGIACDKAVARGVRDRSLNLGEGLGRQRLQGD
jgi:hypothetical protein